MKRFSLPLVAFGVFSFSSIAAAQGVAVPGPAAGQAGAPRPTVPGTQRPGLPPRDAPAAPQTGTARVRGRVLALDGNAPLRRAQVTLTLDGAPLRRLTSTDGEGRFEFTELPAGRYNVNATKAGYVSLQYGQRRPYEGGTPLVLSDGQLQERVDFSLPRGSVIVVRLTDEFGEPIAGAQVQVQRYQYGPDGQRRLMPAPMGGVFGLAGTDDQGMLRAYGLMPGEYVVQASVRSGLPSGPGSSDNSEGFSPTFYPGTISAAEAQPIAVTVGQETSIQFSMIPVRLARVSGVVVDSEGRPAAGAQLGLRTQMGTGYMSSGLGVAALDGSFTINGVPPGEHTIEVRPTLRGRDAPAEFAEMPIVVSGDITGLRITTTKGGSVSGRLVFEGTSPRTGASTPLRVMATSVDPTRPVLMGVGVLDPLANGTVDDDGNFQIGSVSGQVFLNAVTPPGWIVKSVSLDGNDITDVPLDVSGRSLVTGVTITLTDKLTTVSGKVADNRGQPAKDYVAVIVPAEPKEGAIASRFIRVARPDTNGAFQVRGMRPGRYIAAAVESLEQGRQFAPDFQSRVREVGRSFSVAEGGSATLALELNAGL